MQSLSSSGLLSSSIQALPSIWTNSASTTLPAVTRSSSRASQSSYSKRSYSNTFKASPLGSLSSSQARSLRSGPSTTSSTSSLPSTPPTAQSLLFPPRTRSFQPSYSSSLSPSSHQIRSLSILSRIKSILPSSPSSSKDGSASIPSDASTSTGTASDSTKGPLTFDQRITAIAAGQGAKPEDFDESLKLFGEMMKVEDAELKVENAKKIADNWEKLGGWDPSKKLLHSNEAFSHYISSLLLLNRNLDLTKAVRIRDDLLLASPLPTNASTSSFNATTSSASATSPSSSSDASTLLSGTASAAGAPIHVIVDNAEIGKAEGGGWKAWPIFWRTIGGTLKFLAFATVAVLVMEQAGTLKLGPTANEFTAGQDGGKVVKFADVRGVEEAKEELQEVVEFLKDPEKFSTLGGRLPKGVLLTGPPGTGKTMLARAVAGEAGVPFFFASGSEFDEMFVGVGAKRIRELFAAAKKKSPAIIFIDELDSVGAKRSAKDPAHSKQAVNQLLTELDGFAASTGVIVIAATNFPQSLDPALVRPGRFDRHVAVPLPDVRGRVEILKSYLSGLVVSPTVDVSTIARGTPGMSGADLQNLVNQAAVKASREGAKWVDLHDFEWAKDRIMMGAERKSHFVTPEAKKMTAYHEGGHALVALLTPGSMPLHKVTVLPRGQALGITFQLPEMDRDSFTKTEYLARIDVAMGGRVAEELVYGKENVTSGAHSDLVAASDVANGMVKSMGFSDKVGLVAHGEESVYLSERKKDEIESEVRSLIEGGAQRAFKLLQTNREALDNLANALIRYETLSGEDVRNLYDGKKIVRPDDVDALGGPSI